MLSNNSPKNYREHEKSRNMKGAFKAFTCIRFKLEFHDRLA